MNPLVRNTTLSAYLDFMRSTGVDPLPLLRSVGLSTADLAVPGQWIAVHAVAELLEVSADATGSAAFGLQLAQTRRLSVLGAIGLGAREEPDVRSALQLISRYEHLHSEAFHIRISETDGLATVKIELDLAATVKSRQLVEQVVGTTVRVVRALVGGVWKPVTVCFRHDPPADLTVHHRVLESEIRFGAEFDGLVMFADDLEAPNSLADPLLRPLARQYVEGIAAGRPGDDLDRIRELVEALLPTGRCSLQQVARTLGVDRKTVHRRLVRADTTFSALLNSTRLDLARQYVGHQRRPLGQVAELLGFSEPSAFSRWFRGEFGASPTSWRATHRTGDVSRPDPSTGAEQSTH
ncbi:AraC family transcriptional regulator [Rhodococcus aetherivorans]|uniref:AraC family transcriptional regulator n=1 Tax=Rhodococcus aetherivorans TaxID=191292 RepID=UPI00367CF564